MSRGDAAAGPANSRKPPLGPVARTVLERLGTTTDPAERAHIWHLYLMARARDFGIHAA